MAKLLIIDNDPDIVLAVRLCLEGRGHELFEAPDGDAGLQKVIEVRPDLIILDVMMSNNTEGFQVALRLRSPDPASPYLAYRNIPIIILSAVHSTTRLRFEPDEDYLPVDAFLDKPIDPQMLVERVEALLVKAR